MLTPVLFYAHLKSKNLSQGVIYIIYSKGYFDITETIYRCLSKVLKHMFDITHKTYVQNKPCSK